MSGPSTDSEARRWIREAIESTSYVVDPHFGLRLRERRISMPDALAVLHGWRDHELLRRALDIFGLASLAEAVDAPKEIVDLAQRRREARAARDFDEADRLRAEIEAAGWEARDVADGFQLVPR